MYLKSDFLQTLQDAAASRPAVAAAFRAGDPRVIAQVNAVASMFAMLSQQLDVAEVEPFVRARLGTVIADCALKGVLPLGKPAKVSVTVTSTHSSPITLAAGRGILDSKGRRFTIDGAATVPANGTATITAQQLTSRQVLHTVTATAPFYEVLLAASPEGSFVAGLDVEDADGNAYAYTPDFCNVTPGDRVFHVETDEYRRLIVRFGADDAAGAVVGFQPPNGTVLTITMRECAGSLTIDSGSEFALEYVASAPENKLKLTLDEVLSEGAMPPSADVLRMLARYPALNDGNAVFLGNFDFLLRRHMPSLEFLSVWNEQAEELVRGANVANINKLFVAFKMPSQSTSTTQNQIRSIISRADDSYRVQFVTRRDIEVPVTVSAQVSVVHDPADVEAQIRTVLIQQYGQGSVAASRGLTNTFRRQLLNNLLEDNVPALQDQLSDFSVSIGSTPDPLPEDYRYFTDDSITVTVTRAQGSTGLWNG